METVKKEERGGEVLCFEQRPAEYCAPFPLRSVTECRESVNLVNSVPKFPCFHWGRRATGESASDPFPCRSATKCKEPVNLFNNVPKLSFG